MKTIWFFVKPYKRLLLIPLGFSLANGFFETFQMALLYPILSASLEKGGASGNNPFFIITNHLADFIPVSDVLIKNCILFVIFTLFYFAARLIYFNLSARITALIVRESEKKVFEKFTEFDYRFFVENKQGDLLYKGSQAPQFIGMALNALTRSVVEIILAISVLLLLISISWKGTVAVIFAGVAYYYFTRYLGVKISYATGHGMQQAIQRENIIINEYINGVKSIKAAQTSSQWQARFSEAVTARWNHWKRNTFWVQVPPRVLELLLFGSIATVVIGIKLQYPDSFFSMIPMFGTFAFAVFKLLPRLSSSGTLLMQVANSLPNLEVVRDLLTDKTYSKIKNGAKPFLGFRSRIEFRDVSFTYASRETTLRNISLMIEKDKTTAIVGPSGSGKSTLVDLLLRLYDVNEGEILIDKTNIKDYDISTFLTKVGFVGQETFIYNASVGENIAFGCDHPMQQIVEAAKLANAHEFIQQLPEGYDTIVGDRGVKLSGGERQRIAIARAMVRKPQILILDEATSSLDNVSEAIVQKAIDKVSESCTTLVIAHRLSTIRNANTIYVLDNGRIIENGTHNELIGQRGKYWELYNIQGINSY